MTADIAVAYAGLDLGTSGCKGTLLGADGQVLARAQAGYPTSRPVPGAAEQDPADWLAAIAEVAAGLARAVHPRSWRGIGLSAMLPTLVLARADGTPTGPAITWEDARAEEQGDALRGAFGADALYRRTGQWVDGRYLIPMATRLRDAAEGQLTGAARLLGAKDWVFGVLTGEYLSDPSTATGTGCYDLHTGEWIDGLADGLPALPGIAPSHACRPLRTSQAATLAGLGLAPGIPVCLGGADSVLGAVGLGVSRPGQVACIAGTSNVILAHSAEPTTDPAHRYLVTPMPVLGGWGLEMDLLCTGSAHRWLARLVAGGDQAALAALAAAVDPDDAPVFLPYLLPGEQGARWDPDLAGTVAGLHLGHGPGHLARALQAGIVAESRRCLELLGHVTGSGEIFLAGGGAGQGPGSLAADLADATGRPVYLPGPDRTDSSAIGAAMAIASAVDGIALPVPSAADAIEPAGTVILPDPANADRWNRIAERHEAALDAITTFYRKDLR
jgi:sugar (pentulose or hexulose) kinase